MQMTKSFPLPAWAFIILISMRGVLAVLVAFFVVWTIWLWPAQIAWSCIGIIALTGVAHLTVTSDIKSDENRERFIKVITVIFLLGLAGVMIDLVFWAIQHPM